MRVDKERGIAKFLPQIQVTDMDPHESKQRVVMKERYLAAATYNPSVMKLTSHRFDICSYNQYISNVYLPFKYLILDLSTFSFICF